MSNPLFLLPQGCKLEDMPPHIYSAGQMAYRTLMSTKKDQSIAFIGRSGSGKSTNFRHVLTYLVHAAGSVNNILPIERYLFYTIQILWTWKMYIFLSSEFNWIVEISKKKNIEHLYFCNWSDLLAENNILFLLGCQLSVPCWRHLGTQEP